MSKEAVTAYVASGFGFTEATRGFMRDVYIPALKRLGIVPINPWDLTSQEEIDSVFSIKNHKERLRALQELNWKIGERNKEAIDTSQILIANLDGQEVDSGVASEIGYAVGKGKTVFGWRGDIRKTGEEGAIVNLQVQYFIEYSGGKIATSLQELEDILRDYIAKPN